jgi:hypothetical protein
LAKENVSATILQLKPTPTRSTNHAMSFQPFARPAISLTEGIMVKSFRFLIVLLVKVFWIITILISVPSNPLSNIARIFIGPKHNRAGSSVEGGLGNIWLRAVMRGKLASRHVFTLEDSAFDYCSTFLVLT